MILAAPRELLAPNANTQKGGNMAAAAKKVIATLSERDDKKGSVRFIGSDDEEVLTNIYVMKPGMEKLGNPAKIKVTIEAVS
jgi:hypothetical protein